MGRMYNMTSSFMGISVASQTDMQTGQPVFIGLCTLFLKPNFTNVPAIGSILVARC